MTTKKKTTKNTKPEPEPKLAEKDVLEFTEEFWQGYGSLVGHDALKGHAHLREWYEWQGEDGESGVFVRTGELTAKQLGQIAFVFDRIRLAAIANIRALKVARNFPQATAEDLKAMDGSGRVPVEKPALAAESTKEKTAP